ncbi:MAG: acpP [Frankiales bacterium]|nr:acpP [Frankiales bacterium]
MTRELVLAAIQSAVSTVLEVDPATVSVGLRFVEDLKADSLALVEIVEIVEEQLADRGFAFADEDLDDLLTVGDALDYAVGRLG